MGDTIVVCCCGNFPGLHAFKEGECNYGMEEEHGYPCAFVPTQAEIDYQKECKHADVFDSVCMACGIVLAG